MLIYDLGFNNGDDTDYYLKKGHKVIAVEANPYLIEHGIKRFQDEYREGRFVLLSAIFHLVQGQMVTFYINPKYSEWGTCDPVKMSYWKEDAESKQVNTVNLKYLFNNYGIPGYIKTDIEGLDHLVLQQLLLLSIENKDVRVPYLSFELSRFDYYQIFSYLYICGYTKFKLINQFMNDGKIDKTIDYKFGKYHSGLFGEDIFREDYLSFDECLTRYMKYKELKAIDNQNLALGWIDIHAKL